MGEVPEWPDTDGKRIFAYLKPFPAVASLLSHLKELKSPTLAYIPGLDEKTKEKIAGPSLHFSDRPLNMEKVVAECDVGILNGTHTTTANLLMAGKPTLHFPLYLEQHLTAQRVEKLGAGLNAETASPQSIKEKLDMLLNLNSYVHDSKFFSASHRNPFQEKMMEKILAVAGGVGPRYALEIANYCFWNRPVFRLRMLFLTGKWAL